MCPNLLGCLPVSVGDAVFHCLLSLQPEGGRVYHPPAHPDEDIRMRSWLERALLCVALLIAPTAMAQDDEDLLEGDEEEEDRTPPPKRLEEGDEIEVEDDEAELDQVTPSGETGADDLLGGEIRPDQIGGPGQDNASIYREYQEEVSDYVPDEEMLAWERYLDKFPNSLFKDRIEKRMEELSEILYQQRIDRGGEERLDADAREIPFSQGLQIENLNPRTRIQAGFEWGIPDYINLIGDYEHQLMRTLSVHGGVRHRYTGWRLGAGARWAFVKASRTQTIVALIGDVELNTLPAYPVLRPQIGAGKKFGPLDAQIQAGIELDTRADAAIREIGGLNLTYRAAENVAIFGETTAYMQQLNVSTATTNLKAFFRFNTANFGLKFYPAPKNMKGVMEMNLGASLPYTQEFWMFHFGSIMAQMNYYPPAK